MEFHNDVQIFRFNIQHIGRKFSISDREVLMYYSVQNKLKYFESCGKGQSKCIDFILQYTRKLR